MRTRDIISRILFLIVFVSNMICIVEFIVDPGSYIYSYQVNGSAGAEAAIRGIGVAFAMWNVTYPFYIFRRQNDRVLGLIIIVQQLVGLIGELYIKYNLGDGLDVLAQSINRFVWFDAGGLVLLVVGYILINRTHKRTNGL